MQPTSRNSSRTSQPLVYEKLSDPILVTRARDGDAQALEALCARHAPKVERLARHLLDDREDARDAAQESLAKLCVRIRQFRGESQFATWLHRLVVNTCRDVAQRQRARATEPLRLPDPLLYWSPTAPAADRLPGGAILVTPVGADLAPNSWAPPDRPGASGYLILYSLAHDRVAGSTPFSLPR